MILSVLVLAGAAAFFLLRHAQRPGAVPNIDGLKAVLETSASNALPGAGIESEKLTVYVAKEAVAAETQRILRLAGDAGGTAFQTGDQPEILASIPAGKAERFIQSVTGRPAAARATADSGGKELVDVVIQTSAVSTPAP